MGSIKVETEEDKAEQESNKKEGYETVFVEETFAKIAELMRVGFGSAGVDIIAKNLNFKDEGGKDSSVNVMVPGKRITAIYMFADIRKFTDTTECLQEDVMKFVNTLGTMVHSSTHHYYGMANKNVGDAFLLSWKIGDLDLQGYSDFDMEYSDQHYRGAETHMCTPSLGAGEKARHNISATEMAEAALLATIKIQNDLIIENRPHDTDEKKNGLLVQFLNNPRVRDRMFKKNPNFTVGFLVSNLYYV